MADELADQLIDNSGVQGDASPPPVEHSEPAVTDRTETPKRSLRDEIKASWKTVEAKEAGQPEPKPEPKVDTTGRVHAPDGKFAPKTDAAPVEAAPAIQSPATKEDAQPVKASTPSGPPPGWSKESKAVFATLPPSVQADVLKRETEVSNGFKQYSDKSKRYDELDAILAPRRATLQQLGVANDAQAINALLQWEEYVRTRPVQAIQELARSRNIDLSQLAQSTGQLSDASPDAMTQLRPVLDQVVQPLQAQLQSLTAEREREKQERVQSDIAAFSKDKPHFEAVRALMGRMIQSGAATDMESAYQMAIYADPTVRASVLEEQAKAQNTQAVQTQRAAHARQAAVSVTSRAPTGPITNGSGKKPAKGTGVRGSILAAIEEVRENQRA